MKILAIDTATEACSVALYLDGQVLERCIERPKGHGALLLGMMDELLHAAGLKLRELDALAFGRGPGAFTGVRIAVATAQAVGFGAGLPLVPVSNLALLAQGLYRDQGATRVMAILDARMGEVYVGGYEIIDGIAQAAMPEQVIRPEAFWLDLEGDWHGVGSGWVPHSTVLKLRLGQHITSVTTDWLCQAQDLLPFAIAAIKQGQTVPPDQALPLYLRDQVAWKRTDVR